MKRLQNDSKNKITPLEIKSRLMDYYNTLKSKNRSYSNTKGELPPPKKCDGLSLTGITRRDLFKLGGLAVATAFVSKLSHAATQRTTLAGKKLAMVIDLQRCTGCGGCTIACKNENNLQKGVAWANRIIKTTGKFPNVRYEYIPTLCNHCEKAPCVQACPTGAMHKEDGDITMHTPDLCIGCKTCIAACPYGVIYFNRRKTHKFWRTDESLIKGCTSSPAEVTRQVKGTVIPYYNPDRERNMKGSGLRYRGIVEKCTFCDHRIKRGNLPYCVLRCPAEARIFGDMNDPNSKVNQILGKYRPFRLKEYVGTEPKVFYVREYNPGNYRKNIGSV